MERFIEYNKLSKNEKQKKDALKRRKWSDYGCLCPVSKVIPNKKKQLNKYKCRERIFFMC